MTYPIDLHPRDKRPPEEQQDNIINLNVIQDVLEESIGSYAIQNPENIYDEEFQMILRVLEFSRGMKTHRIVLVPDGIIRFLSPKFPSALLLEVHNALVGIVVFDAPEEDQ